MINLYLEKFIQKIPIFSQALRPRTAAECYVVILGESTNKFPNENYINFPVGVWDKCIS